MKNSSSENAWVLGTDSESVLSTPHVLTSSRPDVTSSRLHVRDEFPVFAANPGLVYLDSAATSQKPQRVIDRLNRFYARSRGIPAEAADRLLTYAFAAEVVEEVTLAPVREELDRLVLDRLGGL